MRIAVVAPGYAPTVGGVETVVTQVSRELVRHGCEVEVWTHQSTPASEPTAVADGVVVRRFARAPRGRYPFSPALWRYAAANAGRVDVVHGHGYHSTASAGLVLGRVRTPIVVSPHYHGVGHTPAAQLMHRAYRPFGARLIRGASALIAVSTAEAQRLGRDFGAGIAPVSVIHNGADTASINIAAPFSGEPPTALVLGRLEPYKRVDRVIAAFAAGSSPAQLVVVGDGPDRARLRRLAAHDDRVRFLGRVPSDDVARWLRTARCVVSMSEQEAFGLVALEGAAGGARVVLSDIAAHREVAALVGAPAQIVSNDAELSRALDDAIQVPNAGNRQVRSWTDVAAEHLAVYQRVATR